MKNFLLFLLTIACFSALGQSKYSLNLVAKISSANWKINDSSPYTKLSDKNGITYSLGIEGAQFINKKRTLSIGYGFLNQYSKIYTTSEVEQINDFTRKSEYKITSLEILFPITMKVHSGDLKIYYGFIPTYHLNTNFSDKSTWIPSDPTSNIVEQELISTNCNALFGNCFFFDKPKPLKDFDFQYLIGFEIQAKRFNFFVEYSQYIKPNTMGSQGFDDLFINSDFIGNTIFGSFDKAFTFGTSFKIH